MPHKPDKSANVLVVEDEEFVRSAVVGILRSLGFTSVTAVASSAEALRIYEESPRGFAIAVFDISLADRRIEELASQLPASHGIESLVLCSGGTTEDFDSAQAAFEQIGVPNIHRRKKPVGIADFKTALLD